MLVTPALGLFAFAGVALTTQNHSAPTQAVAAAAPDAAPSLKPATSSTTAAPVVVTAPTTTVAPPRPPPAPTVKPAVTAVAPATTQAPVVAAPRAPAKVESCGWAWDAQRIDDGSYDGVVISLDAPYRPNTPVTITAAPHGPTTAPTVRAVVTDGNGQASLAVRLSEDKRDWTITISALFPTSRCSAQSFTIAY